MNMSKTNVQNRLTAGQTREMQKYRRRGIFPWMPPALA